MALYRFDRFTLDTSDRRIARDGKAVELNARYLDALGLLVAEAGRLVTKDRFMDEVWRGVPVTDEALTQCIRTLRRLLDDDASAPRFIETVPKHGYRFIAPVEDRSKAGAPPAAEPGQHWALIGAAGTVGSGLAGLVGGLLYGFAGASQPLQPGLGAVSVLLVLLCLTILAALLGGLGVSFGIALAQRYSAAERPWQVAGGAFGGMLIGAIAKLLGLDAFNLLLGQSPGDITGGPEGLLLGGGVGLGAWLAGRLPESASVRRRAAVASLAGAGAGLVVTLTGGHLMAGSLNLLGRSVSGSQVRMDQIGHLLGEGGFGVWSRMLTSGVEGALFAGCIVAAMEIARRQGRPQSVALTGA